MGKEENATSIHFSVQNERLAMSLDTCRRTYATIVPRCNVNAMSALTWLLYIFFILRTF
jgi:hypothetical protein